MHVWLSSRSWTQEASRTFLPSRDSIASGGRELSLATQRRYQTCRGNTGNPSSTGTRCARRRGSRTCGFVGDSVNRRSSENMKGAAAAVALVITCGGVIFSNRTLSRPQRHMNPKYALHDHDRYMRSFHFDGSHISCVIYRAASSQLGNVTALRRARAITRGCEVP